MKITEICFRKARITGELCDSSVEKYRDSIKKFFAIINKEIELLEIGDFEEFILAMKDNEASNSRIANVISSVKWLINKVRDEKLSEINIDLEKIKKPKIGNKEVVYLTEQEIEQFIDSIDKDISSGVAIRKIRFMALAVFLLQTGARIGEVLSINKKDIDRQNKEILIIGKGNKPRTLFLKSDTLYWLDKYMAIRKDSHEALFVSLSGRTRWMQTDVGRCFRRYKKLSGIMKEFTIHTLRHTCATQLLLKGVSINIIQYILGHANLETTIKYYIGAVKKEQAKQIIKDNYFDFIPQKSLKVRG